VEVAVVADGAVAEAPGARRWPWWSFSKTVLAACALKLAEAGALQLDVALPGRDFTLRDLLQHRAGLPDYGGLPAYRAAVERREPAWGRDAFLAVAGGRLFAPGQGWAYSNIGYGLVREVVEAAAGAEMGAAVEALVCAPLGVGGVTLAKRPEDFGGLPGSADYDPGWVFHGCLVGTAAAAARLLDGLLGGRLLGAEMLAEMRRCHPLGGAIEGRPWLRHGYALGLMCGEMAGKDGGAVPVAGHTGGGPFSVAAVYRAGGAAPLTVAAFAAGGDTAAVERAVAERLERA
jgi:CubicO group peptidase (beta-lactamase class C family)